MSIGINHSDTPAAVENRLGMRLVVEIAIGTLLLFLLIFGCAAYYAGSVGRAWPYLMGQRLFVSTRRLDLGSVLSGTELKESVRLINRSSEPLRILGARKSCSCITLDSFPLQVPAGGYHDLQLKLRVPELQPGVPSALSQSVELYVEDQRLTQYKIVLSGSVVEK